ncbi:hypothetical protein [Amylibacter marinus]|uniref:hypothetical protein n=1 Tax=Amylibacter marinus TaxID=1475483 RepID=UPI0024E083AA|nr:hypothetical protein [Amylibacter marinus]
MKFIKIITQIFRTTACDWRMTNNTSGRFQGFQCKTCKAEALGYKGKEPQMCKRQIRHKPL